uniref:Cytoplasmic male sterility protein 60 n=1 Tax=Brassica oleracea var. capitata TaxID=3716 RepID=B3GTB0_BRAOC|nr:cytoplasmic male sterility protein 60 [Brassica oleracea var. capitata]
MRFCFFLYFCQSNWVHKALFSRSIFHLFFFLFPLYFPFPLFFFLFPLYFPFPLFFFLFPLYFPFNDR